MLTACLSMMLHLLLLLIRIAMKLRLSIPLVYLVLMLTVFQPWYHVHTAFAWRKPARMRSRPAKPHTSAQRASRRGANSCADVHFLTCAAVQPLIFRPEAALGSGFSLQAAFWYQNAMLALFLRGKKSLKRSLILVPSRRKNQFFVSYNT